LLDLIIFNVLACNTDAHAKNYSIMLRGNGASLAPMYDVMCGEVWENVTKHMVQKIGGTRVADQLTGRHWRQLARECGLNPGEVLDRVAALAKSVIAEAGMAESEVAAMPAGGHAILYQTRQAIERRALALLARLHEFGDISVADVQAVEAEASAALDY
jgi:serine/threonine-protein kinase HipA